MPTLSKASFAPKVKIGSSTFQPKMVTVNGKKLSAVSLPLLVADKATEGGITTYTLYTDIIEPTLKYVRTLVLYVDVDDTGSVVDIAPAFL